MPKKQSTAARKARQRQAATGEKYTTALRSQGSPVRHRAFSADGAGWAPIIERAERSLDEVWPGHPRPYWEEKYGDLCWKFGAPVGAPAEVWTVIEEATREASSTCQTCPSPGRKRVVWNWDSYYGWVMPWVKTCCDACYHVPPHLRSDRQYLALVDQYEARG